MFIRLLHVRVNPETFAGLERRYADIVIPALIRVPGCFYAGLVQSLEDASDAISLTMWESQARAVEYEQSGKYRELVEATREFYADSTDFTMKLSQDLELEYIPVPTEPVITGYAADMVEAEESELAGKLNEAMYLRIVSLRVEPGKIGEFITMYRGEIIPALHLVDGCKNACVAGGVREKNEVISITIWDTLEHARVYELSGEFDALRERIRHTLTRLALWKIGLEESTVIGSRTPATKTVTSDDTAVRTYSIVVGRAF